MRHCHDYYLDKYYSAQKAVDPIGNFCVYYADLIKHNNYGKSINSTR